MSAGGESSATPVPAPTFHVKRAARRLRTALLSAFLAPLRAYMRWVSPALPRRCRYEPTCSAYAEQAIRELGVLRGSLVAAWRLARCNPLSHGGIDDVADRRLFRSVGATPEGSASARASTTGPGGDTA